jgi:hypothetical protein
MIGMAVDRRPYPKVDTDRELHAAIKSRLFQAGFNFLSHFWTFLFMRYTLLHRTPGVKEGQHY